MCMVSMIYDHGRDWLGGYPQVPVDYEDLKRRVKELEEAMKKAKELDEYLNQPDCETEKKKNELREHAKRLGIEIKFPE